MTPTINRLNRRFIVYDNMLIYYKNQIVHRRIAFVDSGYYLNELCYTLKLIIEKGKGK